MQYARVLSYVARTPWAIDERKMDDILDVLAHRAAGHEFSPAEIRARIGSPVAPSPTRQASIAIVPLRGVICHRIGGMQDASGGMSTERFSAMLRQAVADPSVGTIVLDVDSPGGTIPGVSEAAADVFTARASKRIIAVANSMMCSAAYWIAAQAHELVAIPSALDRSIGSIGVFAVTQDLTAALEKEGIKTTVFRAGKRKGDGNPFEPLSPEARADIQASVDRAYAQFVRDVARGRGVSVADVERQYGQGRAVSASEAKAMGLIDRIERFDRVVSGLTGGSARAVLSGAGSSHGAAALASTRDPDAELRRRVERY